MLLTLMLAAMCTQALAYEGLHFVSRGNNADTVRMRVVGGTALNNPTIECKYNNGPWQTMAAGLDYPLTKTDTLWVRGQLCNFSAEHDNVYTQFEMSGRIAAKGSIMSLYNRNANQTTITKDEVFTNLFQGCTALVEAPELPATQLSKYCYYGMFERCTNLQKAPYLPATALKESCYRRMFAGCSNLHFIFVQFENWTPANATKDWVYNVPTTGRFVGPDALDVTNKYNIDQVPATWDVRKNVVLDTVYLQVEKEYDGTNVCTLDSFPFINSQKGIQYDAHFNDAEVGNNKLITCYCWVDANNGQYYMDTVVYKIQGKILPRVLHVADAQVVAQKEYDGTDLVYTNAADEHIAILNIIAGEDVYVTGDLHYDTPAVGTGKTIEGTLTLAGTKAANYVLDSDHYTNYNGIITRRQIIDSTAVVTVKEYDGIRKAEVLYCIPTNVVEVNGVREDVQIESYALYDTWESGTGKTIKLFCSLIGEDKDNYEIPDGRVYTTEGEIYKRMLEFYLNVETSKHYDNTDTAVVIKAELLNVAGTDDVDVVAEAHYEDSVSGSNKDITVYLSLTGSQAYNYDIESWVVYTHDGIIYQNAEIVALFDDVVAVNHNLNACFGRYIWYHDGVMVQDGDKDYYDQNGTPLCGEYWVVTECGESDHLLIDCNEDEDGHAPVRKVMGNDGRLMIILPAGQTLDAQGRYINQ